MAIRKELLEELNERRAAVSLGGGADKLAKRHQKGQLTARERIEGLYDKDSFQESGAHVNHQTAELKGKVLPGDGVITGIGQIDGRPVAAFSQDFTVSGGSLGRMHAKKICDMMDTAANLGVPVVAINDSGGARIQEAVHSLSGYGQIFYRNVAVSGLVPQIAIIAGPCAGGAAYSPALMDFLIMTRKNSQMFICGPDVIKAATGQEAPIEMFGTAEAHASVSGNIHFIAEDDKHALEITRKLLSYLPSNNLQDPPHHIPTSIAKVQDEGMNELVPEGVKSALDAYKVINRLVDGGDFFEVMREFAKSLVIGFARIEGMVVGILANQPTFKAGVLDVDSSDKGARFIRFCNAFNIPIVNLVNVPGFMPGLAQERAGIIRHGAKMLFAYSAATVPKLTLILGKSYGGAYLAMCSKDLGADFVYAWPTAEIAVMGAEGAVRVIYKKEIDAAEDKKAKEAELIAKYRKEFASPYQAAENGMINDVIAPSETRSTIALALRLSLTKRVTRPPKKHGLIPL
ncbi:acyl-CoA carboxylase subunit beta [Propionivibrio sp.]|jgi:propionyl-CoA carboxylase beta chain|uniref:acyl-CoA carboxylase subunit beta n=1 Tax=Propionivibrio sp. TaxID=2212460 RepID=UPI00272E9A9B|nr:acyl-CoA carboxylase subunit beta [Propionivibrio sp.]